MAEDGEEKLLAMARQIAKKLGHDDSMTDEILHIFSRYDSRFSRDKMGDDDIDLPHRPYAPGLHPTLDRQISHYLSSDLPIWADSAASAAFLDAIDELTLTLRDWSPLAATDKTVFTSLSRADDLLQQSMFRLQDEFRSLMVTAGESYESTGDLPFDSDDEEDQQQQMDDQIPVARPLTDYDVIIEALPPGTISDLHEIAKRMVAAGFGKECCHVYSGCRREFLEESMSRLGLQKLSIEEAQKMPWPELEDEIERWMKAMNVALRILFPSERRLCDRVFAGLSSTQDLSFMEVCRGSTVQLLNFADAIAIGSRSPERLFKVLDVFETLRDLLPEFHLLFSDQFCVSLRNEAGTIWKRLGEAIRGTFMELEHLIRRDPAKVAVPGGGLHPITRYVMNYVRAACRSRMALEQVFEESVGGASSPNSSSSSLSVQMGWIMDLLESNLEAKAKMYGDQPALAAVFMMNNVKYIVQKVRDGDQLASLLGEDWIRKHSAKVRQYQQSYMRSSWNKLVAILNPNPNQNPNPRAGAVSMRLKEFSLRLEETCRSQSTWVFADEQVKEELRVSVIKVLVSSYQGALGQARMMEQSDSSRKQQNSSSSPFNGGLEEIEARINELFARNNNSSR